MTNVKLLIDGTNYDGWLNVSVSIGIEQMARAFRVDVTDRWPGNQTIRRIKPHQSCEIYIDDAKIITGYVDATPINYDATQIAVGISGRSKTGDIIDCSAPSKTWVGQPLSKIASDLCAPYGVSVRCNTDHAIDKYSTQSEDSPYDCILRLVERYGMLAYDDANGNLIISTPGKINSGGKITAPGNVLSGRCGLDYTSTYSAYVVSGQSSSSDIVASSRTAADKDVPRYRRLSIRQTAISRDLDCLTRAQFEQRHRRAKAQECTYTVPGWHASPGELWSPNTLVQVGDPVIGINRLMLITAVDYDLQDNSYTTTLQLCPQEAY